MPEAWKPWVGGFLILCAAVSVWIGVEGLADSDWETVTRFATYGSALALAGVWQFRRWRWAERFRVVGLVPTLAVFAAVQVGFVILGAVEGDLSIMVAAGMFGGIFGFYAWRILRGRMEAERAG